MLNPPSVNQITSAYTGHMPQLAQRVNEDKQAHGGIAQDLRMLMAEDDMTKALQNSQTQAALQQPQNPPTVAQGIHDRLRQLTQGQPRMQPQAAQPQFQGAPQPAPQGLAQLQAGQNPAPPAPNVAPPQGLPEQGIDQLPANVGQSYAEGGIIGFDGTDAEEGSSVPEATSMAGDVARGIASPVKKAADWIEEALSNATERQRIKKEIEKNRPGFFESLTPAQKEARQAEAMKLAQQIKQVGNTPAPSEPAAPTTPVVQTPFNPETATRRDAYAQVPPANQGIATNLQAPSPAAPVVPAQPAAPAEMTLQEKIMKQAMEANPEALRVAAEARRDAIKRDTSAMDKLQAEYASEKERLAPPKQGYDAFMELMGQIAQAPRGVGSLTAGSMGVQKVKDMEQARALQRHELTKQMLDVGQKKADIGYTQALETMGVGDAAKASAMAERYKAAIAATTDANEKAKLAQEFKLRMAEMEIQRQRTAAMNKPDAFEKIFNTLKQLNPKADQAQLLEKSTILAGMNRSESVDAQILGKLGEQIKQLDVDEDKLKMLMFAKPEEYKVAKAALDKRRATTEAMMSQVYGRIGSGGLPDLNKANPGSPTAAPGQPDYSKLWK